MRHSYIDKYSDIGSYIHRIEPRIKIISIVTFILFIIFTKPTSFATFALYGLFIATLILLSKIPVSFILKKSLVVIPFVAMIAVFIPFFKQGKLAGAYSFGTLRLTITYDGLMIFWNVLAKSYLSILCMILLMTSIKFSDLLKAFEKLKFPMLFIMIISFMYRYIFVIVNELMKMKQAKEARSVGGLRWFHIKALANMIGVLFIRAYERAENVYLAMCSRGFDGHINTINNFQAKINDFCFLLAIICILTGIRIIGG